MIPAGAGKWTIITKEVPIGTTALHDCVEPGAIIFETNDRSVKQKTEGSYRQGPPELVDRLQCTKVC